MKAMGPILQQYKVKFQQGYEEVSGLRRPYVTMY